MTNISKIWVKIPYISGSKSHFWLLRDVSVPPLIDLEFRVLVFDYLRDSNVPELRPRARRRVLKVTQNLKADSIHATNEVKWVGSSR